MKGEAFLQDCLLSFTKLVTSISFTTAVNVGRQEEEGDVLEAGGTISPKQGHAAPKLRDFTRVTLPQQSSKDAAVLCLK